MIDDPFLQEIRRIRDDRAAAFGHDVRAMLHDLKEKQQRDEARGVKFVRLPRRGRTAVNSHHAE